MRKTIWGLWVVVAASGVLLGAILALWKWDRLMALREELVWQADIRKAVRCFNGGNENGVMLGGERRWEGRDEIVTVYVQILSPNLGGALLQMEKAVVCTSHIEWRRLYVVDTYFHPFYDSLEGRTAYELRAFAVIFFLSKEWGNRFLAADDAGRVALLREDKGVGVRDIYSYEWITGPVVIKRGLFPSAVSYALALAKKSGVAE